jgi:hypothetical protein
LQRAARFAIASLVGHTPHTVGRIRTSTESVHLDRALAGQLPAQESD